ncbi:CHAD domain-containing protein [Kaistia defluvii]|uniref:CYTH and CHAD domain-containing protein n=1 Tax=Kaistia defluvii TaxID=410841 RepID=UPI002252D536|nr:CYTH and CHAD domain-containing protein [Kaistia defluvii]MCX5520891.1 CHAD domain-containing protein [Kaistia defluvii]
MGGMASRTSLEQEADLRGPQGGKTAAAAILPTPVADIATDCEIELKLTCRDPSQIAAVATAPILAGIGEWRTRQLLSTYYDTDAMLLRQSGYTLRVREDRGRFVMTVKAQRGVGLTRFEREEAVASASIDGAMLSRLLPVDIADALGAAPLRPLFTARIERRQVTLDFAGSTIEVALDRGQILAGERAEPVAEVELELKRGSVTALYELALELSNHAPLVPSGRTKSDRGFALALGGPGREAANEVRLTRKMSRDQALGALLGPALMQAVDHVPRVADPADAEGVHGMRIALRHIRMALWLVKRSEGGLLAGVLADEVRWLAGELGDARDWDVLAREIVPAATSAGLERAGFRALVQRIEQHRALAHEQAAEAVTSGRAGRLLLSLGLWTSRHGWRDTEPDGEARFAKPIKGFARRTLADLHRQVLRRGRKFDRLDAEGRHHLRIRVKSLAYAADLFLPIVQKRKAARRHVATLKRLQDQLGRLNDAIRASELLNQLAEEGLSLAARRATDIVLARQHVTLTEGEVALRRRWLDFTRTFEAGRTRKRRAG